MPLDISTAETRLVDFLKAGGWGEIASALQQVPLAEYRHALLKIEAGLVEAIKQIPPEPNRVAGQSRRVSEWRALQAALAQLRETI